MAAGGVRKTIDKKTGKVSRQSYKSHVTEQVQSLLTQWETCHDMKDVIEDVRTKAKDVLLSTDKTLLRKMIDKVDLKSLIELQSNLQRASNSDFKVQLLTRQLFTEHVIKMEEFSTAMKTLATSMSHVTDYMMLQSLSTSSGEKRNVAGLMDMIQTIIFEKADANAGNDPDIDALIAKLKKM